MSDDERGNAKSRRTVALRGRGRVAHKRLRSAAGEMSD